ncbi:hypothetical protein [Bradyrhizobium sp. USDA 3262]|nr:hypothetical protein QIH80_23630 [Bradyrhizobium elkanii]
MPRPRLSKAQFRFMEQWVPTQKHWRETAGFTIGAVAATKREQVSLNALIRKGFAAVDGQFTEAGLSFYRRKIKRLAA